MSRWKLFTDAELYSLNNAVEFALPSFADLAEGQWKDEWKLSALEAQEIRSEVLAELRHREGTTGD